MSTSVGVGLVHNASSNNINVKSTTESISYYEPKSVTKSDSGKQLNFNDNNDHRSLSRSKSKYDLLNKSITRSNPISEKRYADFR